MSTNNNNNTPLESTNNISSNNTQENSSNSPPSSSSLENKSYNSNNVIELNCLSLKHLFTIIRDKNTNRDQYVRYSRRLMSIICEEGLSCVNPIPLTVITPTGNEYHGSYIDHNSIVAVSIIRAGDSMLDTFLEICPEATVGKILIQRNEETAQPMLYYSKLPPLQGKTVVVLDPMVATGGSAICALQVLIDKGASINNMFFFNVVSCPEGLKALTTTFPGNYHLSSLFLYFFSCFLLFFYYLSFNII